MRGKSCPSKAVFAEHVHPYKICVHGQLQLICNHQEDQLTHDAIASYTQRHCQAQACTLFHTRQDIDQVLSKFYVWSCVAV